jgi:predicted transcriptional regulator
LLGQDVKAMTRKTDVISLEDPELARRIDALVARTTLSREDILREALEEGRSLAWQEEWLRRVEAGRAEADRGDFATAEDIDRVPNKYRPS